MYFFCLENDFPPTGFVARDKSSTELSLEWDQYPKELWNGPDLYYVILWKPYAQLNVNVSFESKTVGESKVKTTLTDLEVFTVYFISITTENTYGVSPNVTNTTCRTSEGGTFQKKKFTGEKYSLNSPPHVFFYFLYTALHYLDHVWQKVPMLNMGHFKERNIFLVY